MSTLTALARAEAVVKGRAQPIATVRHLYVHDRPMVLIPLALAGEPNAPLAAMLGTAPDDRHLLVVPQPRNRDDRFAFADELSARLVPYLESFTGVAEPIAVDRGRDVRYRFVDAPQVWVPNSGGIDFLKLFGRSTRFRAETPSIAVLGRWLTFLAGAAEIPGSSLLLDAVRGLGMHWATGQSSAEDARLASLIAWITSGAAAGRDAENGPVAGPATDPDFDNHVLAPLLSASSPDLPGVVEEALAPTWQQMWTALDLLRSLPVGERVALRWDADRDSYSGYVAHLREEGAPQPRHDGAVAAASRLQRLENAATRYAVQRAFDDPLVMAEYRLAGSAFGATVTLAAPDRIDDSGKRPVLRPRIMVTTPETVRVEPGASLTSPARPAQKAKVISVTAVGESTEVLLELSGGMGRKLVAEPGSVPVVGEKLLLTTLSEAYRPGGSFPDPADTPWTHGGPPAPFSDESGGGESAGGESAGGESAGLVQPDEQ